MVHGARLRSTANGESCISRSTRNEVTLDSLAYRVASDEESDEDDDTDFRMIDDAEISALARIPEQVDEVVQQSQAIRAVVEPLIERENWLFLGRGYNYPVALEGALKLKEISYIHAEGLPAAEMKHGPIALIHEGMPVVFVAPRGATYEKIIGNIEEVRARGGHVIAVATEGDERIARHAEHVFHVPDCPAPLQPLLTVLPLQLLAYHAAVARGCNVDKPRNLAKSVTVE